MIEHEILTKRQRDEIAKIIGKCQTDGEKCIPEPHRINRGYAGGKYTLKNIDWLCKKHHKERHEKEEMGWK